VSTAHQKIADTLRGLIDSGALEVGERLPGEMELTRIHKVSRNTVRHALSQLEASNYIWRQRGKGTFVAAQGVSHVLGNLRSITNILLDLGKVPGITKVSITLDSEPPHEAAQFLPGSHLWNVERVRTSDGWPFCLMQSWLPDAVAAGVSVGELQEKQSLYRVLGANLDIHPTSATEIIRAEPASADDARKIDVPEGTSLLTTYRWTSDQNGKPIEYVRSASPGTRYEYVIKLVQ